VSSGLQRAGARAARGSRRAAAAAGRGRGERQRRRAHHLRRHHVQELLEVNGARAVLVDVADHLVDGLVLGLEAERLHGSLQLLGVNRAGAIRVEEVERLADLLDLLLAEAGALVALRRALLRGAALGNQHAG